MLVRLILILLCIVSLPSSGSETSKHHSLPVKENTITSPEAIKIPIVTCVKPNSKKHSYTTSEIELKNKVNPLTPLKEPIELLKHNIKYTNPNIKNKYKSPEEKYALEAELREAKKIARLQEIQKRESLFADLNSQGLPDYKRNYTPRALAPMPISKIRRLTRK